MSVGLRTTGQGVGFLETCMYVCVTRAGRERQESKSDSEVEFQPQASRCREGPSPKHIRIVLCAGMGAGVGTASSRVRRVLLCTCLESIHKLRVLTENRSEPSWRRLHKQCTFESIATPTGPRPSGCRLLSNVGQVLWSLSTPLSSRLLLTSISYSP